MIKRMARAMLFDGRLYEDVRKEPTAVLEAVAVVLLWGASIGVGLVLGVASDNDLTGRGAIMLRSLSAAVAGWIAVSLLAMGLGRLLRRKTVLTHTLRTVGYATAPGVFNFVIVIAAINESFAFMLNAFVLLWVMLAMSQAISRSIDMPFSVGLWAGIVGILIMVAITNVFINVLL